MYILFDIGGTHIRVAKTNDLRTLTEAVKIHTPVAFSEGVSAFKKLLEEVAKGEEIQAVVGGIAGVIDFKEKKLLSSPHLPQWVGHSLQELAGDIPLHIENDAALAGLGESMFGSGKPDKIVAYFTISTGIGGARINKGNISDRASGFEPGHQILDYKTKATFEDLISGTALQKKYGVRPSDITDEAVWREVATIAGIGIHNSILHWSPDIVVVGGAVSLLAPAFFIDAVTESLRAHHTSFPVLPSIVKATLGDQSGLWGALAFAQKIATQ